MKTYHNIQDRPQQRLLGRTGRAQDPSAREQAVFFEYFSNAQIVAIAVDELYDRLIAEKKNGENQRRA